MAIRNRYRIRNIAAPGFYFLIWVFGWGSIQKILQKVDFLSQKWGFIQEKPQKLDFSITWGSIQEWGSNIADTVFNSENCKLSLMRKWQYRQISEMGRDNSKKISALLPVAQCLRSEKKVHFKFEWKFWVKTSWENPQTLF